jgi:putative flippase GtrA
MAHSGKEATRFALFGGASAALYALLFWFEYEILAFTHQGGWTFIVPLAIAFLMSYVHGGFTAAFWDWFGIRAKK